MEPNLDVFRAMLVLDEHDLTGALRVQADVLDRIGGTVARLEETVESAAFNLKQAEARVFMEAKATGDKVTDKAAELIARTSPGYLRAAELRAAAEREAGQWRALYAAWRERGYSIKAMVELYAIQYHALTPAGTTRPRRDYSTGVGAAHVDATPPAEPARRNRARAA